MPGRATYNAAQHVPVPRYRVKDDKRKVVPLR
jgi:hypothetical protein